MLCMRLIAHRWTNFSPGPCSSGSVPVAYRVRAHAFQRGQAVRAREPEQVRARGIGAMCVWGAVYLFGVWCVTLCVYVCVCVCRRTPGESFSAPLACLPARRTLQYEPSFSCKMPPIFCPAARSAHGNGRRRKHAAPDCTADYCEWAYMRATCIASEHACTCGYMCTRLCTHVTPA